jgi:hypothetical protein
MISVVVFVFFLWGENNIIKERKQELKIDFEAKYYQKRKGKIGKN